MINDSFLQIADCFTGEVKRIAAGGAGVARIPNGPGPGGGLTVFIDYTAPGDLVTARIKALHGTWAEADLVKIEETSPRRVTPLCPHYGICGGCSLQHLAYETQLAEKTAILKDSLTRIGGFKDLPEIGVVPSPPYGYRNRVQFHTDGGKLGFKGRRSGEIVPIRDCPVADSGIRRFLESPTATDTARFTVYSREGLFLREPGETRGRVLILGREILMDAGVFFQSNAAMLEKLIPAVLAAAEKADAPAMDLYCGVGTFAAFLSERFKRLDLVEENKTALLLARENVSGKGVRFFAERVDGWVRRREGAYGFAVVDPPRQGLSPVVRDYLAAKGPPVLAYVSCDPASLARDCKALCNGNYRLESLEFFDFYPQTSHIESLAVLTGQK
jgi:23S rRNA (uracil1939-C5)-methyltransferase